MTVREAETIRGLDDEQEVAECRQHLPQHASQLFWLPRDWRAACSWSCPVASPDADCCPKHDVLPAPPTPSSTSLSTASLAYRLILSSPSAAAFLDAVLLHGELIPAPNMIPSRPQEVQVLLLVRLPCVRCTAAMGARSGLQSRVGPREQRVQQAATVHDS